MDVGASPDAVAGLRDEHLQDELLSRCAALTGTQPP